MIYAKILSMMPLKMPSSKKLIIQKFQIPLLIVNLETEEIIKWTK